MQCRINFGTDGWRSKLDGDFTPENVARVADAIARYLQETRRADRGVFIGYDGRGTSRGLAETCVSVLASAGVECFMPPSPVPTPVAAFSAVRYSLAGSIMITASHNPPEYNGIKFIPHYGGPAMPEITRRIEQLIPQDPPRSIRTRSGKTPVIELNPLEDYLRHLSGILKSGLSGVRVIVDPMYGATSGFSREVLEHLGATVESIRDRAAPDLGGLIPDPIPENLGELRSRVLSSNCDLGIAFDGDGDRLTAVTSSGVFLMVNQLLPLLYIHLLERRSIRGDVARTVATSHLVDRVAASHGQRTIEVPVGFKYIGELLMRKEVVIGGEESGGMSFGLHIPEKDGVASAAMLMESIKSSGLPLGEMYDRLQADYGRFFSGRIDLRGELRGDPIGSVEAALRDKGELLGKVIQSVDRKDGIKILLGDGSWILFRKSGTEDVVRVYAESSEKAFTQSLLDYGRSLVSSFI
ncbi:MAG: phosphoglucomutase/phosphomannomutase family protein [Candidatus Verstraetearchaeota archaeon]|nr:phosphoglucomutase/phosphomannomutase family protein [Candidatus Verstraetearchaeota archaeon]